MGERIVESIERPRAVRIGGRATGTRRLLRLRSGRRASGDWSGGSGRRSPLGGKVTLQLGAFLYDGKIFLAFGGRLCGGRGEGEAVILPLFPLLTASLDTEAREHLVTLEHQERRVRTHRAIRRGQTHDLGAVLARIFCGEEHLDALPRK